MSKGEFKRKTYREFFREWGFSKIKLNIGFADVEFEPNEDDKRAAWDLYVELLTRITTQPLEDEYGDELIALESINSLFGLQEISYMRKAGMLRISQKFPLLY